MTKAPRKAGYSDDLVALTSIDYSPLAPAVAIAKYQTLKHGPGYWAALKITGLDISHFGPPERERAYDHLATILKTIQFRFSLIKISKRYDLSANQSFLQQKTERTAGTTALDQINAAYEQALTAFQSETLENNYYLVAYAKQPAALVSHITNLQSELEQAGFGTRCLSRAQSLQLQLEIINNYANLDLADFMLEPQHDEQTNTTIPAITIAQVLAFAQIRFGKSHITINEQLKLNIQTISQFPLSLNAQWLATLFNTPANVVMHLNPID